MYAVRCRPTEKHDDNPCGAGRQPRFGPGTTTNGGILDILWGDVPDNVGS